MHNHTSFCTKVSGMRPEHLDVPLYPEGTLIFMIPVANPITCMQVNLLWKPASCPPAQISQLTAKSLV